MRSLQFRAINNSITPIATTLESLPVLGDTTKTNGRYRYNCRTADDNINMIIHSSFNTTNNPITEEETMFPTIRHYLSKQHNLVH